MERRKANRAKDHRLDLIGVRNRYLLIDRTNSAWQHEIGPGQPEPPHQPQHEPESRRHLVVFNARERRSRNTGCETGGAERQFLPLSMRAYALAELCSFVLM